MNLINSKKDAIIELIESNLHQKLQYIPSKLSSMSIKNIGQTLVVDSGIPTDTVNKAYGGIVTQKVANDVMHYYLQKKLPMSWWTGPFSAQNKALERHMQVSGFTHKKLGIGMYCDLVNNDLHSYKIPDKLIIKECFYEKDFSDFGKVFASVFKPRCAQIELYYKQVSTIPIQDREKLRLFIGCVDDEPVVTAGVFLSDAAYLCYLSTRPDMHGKGYGSAMFYTVLKSSLASGYKDIVLIAYQESLGICKRFGFEEICEFNVWSNKELL
ncbi:MAG: GNAT family N-acetyltransferase [Gammaproteobacteria bacterium]|nr:GNAT family N-acetyltransferase [Gammaproteobacteria bacterium]